MIRILPTTIRLPARSTPPAVEPIFVIGCPRSGTTVLGECIGAHPRARSVGESLFLRYLWQMITELAIDGDPHAKALKPFRDPSHAQPVIDATGVYADALFARLAGDDASRRLVDHTPWNAALVPLLVALYPRAHLVHVVRDARAVARSLHKSFEFGRRWAGDDPLYHAQLWSGLVARAKIDAERLAADRYHEVRYEDLCRAPKETLDTVLRGCGLEPNPQCLAPLAVAHAHSGEPTVLATADAEGHVAVQPRTTNVEWPAQWSAEVVARFRATTGELMARLGYTLT